MRITCFCPALVNHAIDDGDGTWEQDWLHNRMRYVESAENLTYNIPGTLSSPLLYRSF